MTTHQIDLGQSWLTYKTRDKGYEIVKKNMEPILKQIRKLNDNESNIEGRKRKKNRYFNTITNVNFFLIIIFNINQKTNLLKSPYDNNKKTNIKLRISP